MKLKMLKRALLNVSPVCTLIGRGYLSMVCGAGRPILGVRLEAVQARIMGIIFRDFEKIWVLF